MSAWLARPVWLVAAVVALVVTAAGAQPAVPGAPGAASVLLKWLPLVFAGFLFNVLVGVLAMALGTAAGVPLGLTQLAGCGWCGRGGGW